MLEQSFTLCWRSIVDATFSEMSKPWVHDMAFVTLVHSIELYFKAKLLEKIRILFLISRKLKQLI